MHKDFYASGFLYHQASQQILLQQNTSISPTSSPWLLFGGIHLEEEEPEAIFKEIIFQLLDTKLDLVHHVYSYSNEEKERNQYVGYSTVEDFKNFSSKNGLSFAWFSFRDVLKLQAAQQVKHDIIVGQRVIEAASRKREGLHTFQ
jgi:hypothetical protein